jgi:hypothetical protein
MHYNDLRCVTYLLNLITISIVLQLEGRELLLLICMYFFHNKIGFICFVVVSIKKTTPILGLQILLLELISIMVWLGLALLSFNLELLQLVIGFQIIEFMNINMNIQSVHLHL